MAVDADAGRELSDYRSLLARRWPWLALGLLLGLAAAFGYLRLATPVYVSTAQVRVLPTIAAAPLLDSRTPSPVNLDTEAQLVKSAVVATRAAELLDSDLSPVELSKRVTPTVPANTDVLVIAFEASSATDAQNGAQSFAEAYLENRQETAQSLVDADVTRLRDQIAAVNRRLIEVTRLLTDRGDPPGPTKEALLSQRQDTLQGQLSGLDAQLQPLRGAAVDSGSVIFDAQRPSGPTDPNPWLVLPSGLMLGLLLGLALATLRERTDRRLHASSDVERLFGLPVLAQLNPRKASLASLAPGDKLNHDLRALFHSVEAASESGARLVLVATPTLSQPAGEIARALCLVAARSGVRTTYVTRMAGSETLLHAAWRRYGNRGDLEVTSYFDLGAVANGEIRPTALISALERMRRERDFVVLDMPTGDPVLDIPVVARHADVVLVAVELGRTSRSAMTETLTVLLRSGASRVFGVTIRRRRRTGGTQSLLAAHASEDESADASREARSPRFRMPKFRSPPA